MISQMIFSTDCWEKLKHVQLCTCCTFHLSYFSQRTHCAYLSKRPFADLKWSVLHNSISSSERDFVSYEDCVAAQDPQHTCTRCKPVWQQTQKKLQGKCNAVISCSHIGYDPIKWTRNLEPSAWWLYCKAVVKAAGCIAKEGCTQADDHGNLKTACDR